MSYLTFLNCHHEYAADIAENEGAHRIDGNYDFLHVSPDPTPLIKKLESVPSSSLTVKTDSHISQIEKFNSLLITDPTQDTSEYVDLLGAYDSLLSSKTDVVNDISTMKNVKGYLDFKLMDDELIDVEDGFDVQLEGRNYGAPTNMKTATVEDAEEYLKEARLLSLSIAEYDPTLIYAPIRGAQPIASAILWNLEKPVKTYFPVTSSFVRGGRFNHKYEISLLENRSRDNDLTRFMYVEEMVSGGMMRGHLKEMYSAFQDRIAENSMNLKAAGLVHVGGKKLNPHLMKRFEKMISDGMLQLGFPSNLFTLDDNEFSGLHFLNYAYGPHNVPYIPDGHYPKKQDLLRSTYKALKAD